MKAAVISKSGSQPMYTHVPEPVANGDQEMLVTMKAIAIKNLDIAKTSGTHYSSATDDGPQIIGSDGVGVLENGTRVYGVNQQGTIAEKAVFNKKFTTPVPDELGTALAAALPNAAMGSAMALRFRAKIKQGDIVLINGATGFTGKIAVQVAKHYGASKIITTGRNQEALQSLLSIGADEIISLKQDDRTFVEQIKSIHTKTPVNVVIDYVWGHFAELILLAFKGNGLFSPKTKFVSVGAMGGDTISLSSQILRSADIELLGSGLGSWTREEVELLFKEILPELFQQAADRKLKADIITAPVTDIEHIWNKPMTDGKRLVIEI